MKNFSYEKYPFLFYEISELSTPFSFFSIILFASQNLLEKFFHSLAQRRLQVGILEISVHKTNIQTKTNY